jgi:hypothetical protein
VSSVPSAPIPAVKSLAPELAKYLEVSQVNFHVCLAEIDHEIAISTPNAAIHLHHVKFDPTTGEPKFDVLAGVLAKHIVRFSLSASTREDVRKRADHDGHEGELYMIARDYFRKIQNAGEVGELLLFFLLEAAFGAPQVVCKMELKTNPQDEIKGADGIHVKWDDNGDHLDVYLGESKLFQDISGALTSALTSISEFNQLGRLDAELHLVTSHFKHLSPALKTAVTAFTNRDTAAKECHVIHACLIGWDWNEYKKLNSPQRDEVLKEFETTYRKYGANIEAMLKNRLEGFAYKHLTFKFLFLPFRDVGQFRRAFYKELCGVDIGSAGT